PVDGCTPCQRRSPVPAGTVLDAAAVWVPDPAQWSTDLDLHSALLDRLRLTAVVDPVDLVRAPDLLLGVDDSLLVHLLRGPLHGLELSLSSDLTDVSHCPAS